MSDTLYTSSPWGSEFHALTTHEALGAGSAGPGKSFVLLMDPVVQIAQEHDRCANPDHPHPLAWGSSRGWALHLRREFPTLKDSIARAHRIFPQLDPGVHWSAADHMFTFSSGYRFEFGHCHDVTDYNNYMSREFTHIGYDELTQFEEEQYHQINTRLRSSDPLLREQLKIRAMSNPFTLRDGFGAKLHDPAWVRKRFVDPDPRGRKLIKHRVVRGDGTTAYKTRIYLPATLYDNPDKEFVRTYELSLLDKPPHIRQAMLYGNWYAAVGGYYSGDWLEDIHVCRPFRIPDHWRRFRSLDWGFKQPGCCLWFALDDEGTLWVEREYTFQNKTAREVAKRIAEIEKDLGLYRNKRSLIPGVADTQLWEQRGDDRTRTKASEMLVEGIGWTPATKDRTRTAQLLLGRLRDHKGRTQTPGIVFFDSCVMLRRTLPTVMADKDDPETPQDGGEDHWHDAVCYGVALASAGSLPSVRRNVVRDDDDEPSERSSFNNTRYGLRA